MQTFHLLKTLLHTKGFLIFNDVYLLKIVYSKNAVPRKVM